MEDGQEHRGDRIFIRRVLILLAIGTVAALLYALKDLLILFFGAVVIAVLLSAVTDPIHRRLPLGRGFALAIAVLVVLGVVAGAGALFGREMAGQVRELSDRLPAAWESVRGTAGQYGLDLPAGFEAEEQPGAEAAAGEEGGNPGGGIVDQIDPSLFGQVSGILMTVFGGLAHTLLVLVGGIYLAAQPALYRGGLLKLVPERSRGLAGDAVDASGKALKLWLLGTLVSMLLVGTLTALGLWIIGVPSWLALGLLAGLFEFIPIIGPIAAAIPGVLLAFTVGLDTALWAIALYLLIQQLEGNVIQPIVQRYAVDLPPALLLFALVAGGLLFGIVGIIFAAPLTVVAYVLVKRLYVREALGTKTKLPHEKAEH